MEPRAGKFTRSEVMARIRSKDTGPELKVRRATHSLGFRFRLHRKDLPGTPDLVFPKLNIALFVHGCFWHQHPGCRRATVPKTRTEFWDAKLRRNVARDRDARQHLEASGWNVHAIWECECRDDQALKAKLVEILTHDSGVSPSRE